MLEILFLIGIFGVAVVSTAEFISGLDAFPTILAAALLAPPLAHWLYLIGLGHYGLEGVNARRRRAPVPPERFFWAVCRERLRVRAGSLALLAGLAWGLALRFPARLTTDSSSVIGWLSGIFAAVATADTVSSGLIFVRATEWFDGTGTRWAGRVRRVMYRVSGDAELLDPEPLPGATEKVQRERSVY